MAICAFPQPKQIMLAFQALSSLTCLEDSRRVHMTMRTLRAVPQAVAQEAVYLIQSCVQGCRLKIIVTAAVTVVGRFARVMLR